MGKHHPVMQAAHGASKRETGSFGDTFISLSEVSFVNVANNINIAMIFAAIARCRVKVLIIAGRFV